MIIKGPSELISIRHALSEFNQMDERRHSDPKHQNFVEAFNADPHSSATRKLAQEELQRYFLTSSDPDTPIAKGQENRIRRVGQELQKFFHIRGDRFPDVIFVSPYLRTRQTLKFLTEGCPALSRIETIEDERIREQEHGILTVHFDRRVFVTLNDVDGKLFTLEGPFWYRFPSGESVSDLLLRLRSWLNDVRRDFSNKRVFVVSHNIAIMGLRSIVEQMSPETFVQTMKTDMPKNLCLTLHTSQKDEGLVLNRYNMDLLAH
jgi:broad specificity phosphatase PhoE